MGVAQEEIKRGKTLRTRRMRLLDVEKGVVWVVGGG